MTDAPVAEAPRPRITVRELLDDPSRFILHYFPHRIRKFKPFHHQLVEVAVGAERGLVLYPAGHGKTTLISELLPIWALCRDPNYRIVITHKSGAIANNLMRATMGEMQTNERLIHDYGAFAPTREDRSRPWSTTAATINQRTQQRPTPSISAFGPKSNAALGLRCDWFICDDIVTTENSTTPMLRTKMRQWFDLVVETAPEFEHSRITVVGTRFHPQDLYGDLLEMFDDDGKPFWMSKEMDAIVDQDKKKTLWPEEWPWPRLMKQKAKFGTLEFNKRYRNIAVDPSQLLFKEQYLYGGYLGRDNFPGCLDKHYLIGDVDPNWRRVAGFDPAVGIQRTAKFCAHVVLAAGSCSKHERCLWVVDLERDQYTMPQQIDMILEKHRRYDLNASWIEANAYQAGLHQGVVQRMNEQGLAYRIDPHYTSKQNKPDPEIGVEALAPWVEQGKMHIPWGDAASKRRMRVLVDEMVSYPGRTTDTVMALWIAWRALDTSAPRFQSFNRLRKRQVWQPRRNGRVVLNPYYQT